MTVRPLIRAAGNMMTTDMLPAYTNNRLIPSRSLPYYLAVNRA